MNFAQINDGDYTLATSLGGFTKGVSPLEMASGYAAVENDGLYREPTCVKSIVDSDENVVYTSSLTEKTVYKQDAERMMTDIMTSVMDSGTLPICRVPERRVQQTITKMDGSADLPDIIQPQSGWDVIIQKPFPI